jgi:Fic family protein
MQQISSIYGNGERMNLHLKNLRFLLESNAIEGVRDAESLISAQQAWNYLERKKKLDIATILETHYILSPKDLDRKYVGVFRDIPVFIGGKEAPHYATVPDKLKVWITKMNTDCPFEEKQAEDLSQKLHVEYEHIHPFVDGNGRTGRMFYNWYRLKNGMGLHTIYELDKEDYYQWFNTGVGSPAVTG